MRITTQMIYSQFNANIQTTMNSIYKSDEQLATGKKLNRPSDDPASVSTITYEKDQLSSFASYQESINSATLLLNATSSALDTLHDLISQAKQIGDSATSLSPTDIATFVSMLDNVINSAIGVANTKVGNKYIFSGYGTDQPAVDTTTGTLTATATDDLIAMQINAGVNVNVNVTANDMIASATAQDTTTVIGAMQALQAAIQTSDQAGIQTALTALDTVSASVVSTEADIGVRLNRINLEKDFLTSRDTDVTNSISNKLTLSTTDSAKLITDIQQKQTSLQSLMSVSSSFLQTNLFDFLK